MWYLSNTQMIKYSASLWYSEIINVMVCELQFQLNHKTDFYAATFSDIILTASVVLLRKFQSQFLISN